MAKKTDTKLASNGAMQRRLRRRSRSYRDIPHECSNQTVGPEHSSIDLLSLVSNQVSSLL